MWKGVTAVTTLRDDLTLNVKSSFNVMTINFIVSVNLRKFSHTSPILFQPCFPSASFYQKIQEFMHIQEIPRISTVL